MKSVLKLFISGLAGFFTVYALMSFSDMKFAGEVTVISLLVISIFLVTLSIFRFQEIKSLNKQNFSGEEEDVVEDRKYKMFADYSLFATISFVFSILALSLSLIATQSIILTISSVILLIITYLLIHYMTNLMEQVYPDRKIPKTSDSDYDQSVLDFADDGEKHVILDGLYKSQGLLNFSLIGAISLATIYSISREDSQIFSIILMAFVLLVVNGKYLFVVRNK